MTQNNRCAHKSNIHSISPHNLVYAFLIWIGGVACGNSLPWFRQSILKYVIPYFLLFHRIHPDFCTHKFVHLDVFASTALFYAIFHFTLFPSAFVICNNFLSISFSFVSWSTHKRPTYSDKVISNSNLCVVSYALLLSSLHQKWLPPSNH